MSHKWRKLSVSCLLALVLVATLGLGCGEDGGGGGATVITVGIVTDLSGPASSALRWVVASIDDWVDYISENDPIPGATLKVIKYDSKYDPARTLPGFEWCKEKGAQVIIAPITGDAEAMKPFAAEDNIPVICCSPSLDLVDPPGWVFSTISPTGMQAKALLKWFSSTQWDYAAKGIPKIATVGWKLAAQMERARGTREYCEAHPDQYDYIGDVLAPVGTNTWTGEIKALEPCDVIMVATSGTSSATFVNQFRSKGYTQQFICSYEMFAFQKLIEDKAGKEALEGTFSISPLGWWDGPEAMWGELEDLLYDLHPDEAEEVMKGWGTAYANAWAGPITFDILWQAVEEVGAENFDGQAFFNTAEKWSKTYEGFPEWTFADGKRYAIRHAKIYEYTVDLGIVQLTDWIPVIED